MASDPPLDGTGSSPVPSASRGRVPAPLDADNSEALLAELDSLLERMMALPVTSLDEEPAALPSRAAPPPDMPVITVTEALPELLSSPPASAVTTTSDDLYVQSLLHEKPEEPPVPTRPPEPVAIWDNPPPKEEKAEPEAPPRSPLLPIPPPPIRPAEGEPAIWMRPILWCNHAVDCCTVPLGAPGRWLRQPGGRTLLGWAGLMMLAAVGGLALCDCLGWTW